jgi:hypothetical protein
MSTGEQPALQVDPGKTFIDLKSAIAVGVFLVSVGGFIYGTQAVADDLAKVKATVELKADRSEAKDRELRIQQLEKFVAVQVEMNRAQAVVNQENKEAHLEIKADVKEVLAAVKAKR